MTLGGNAYRFGPLDQRDTPANYTDFSSNEVGWTGSSVRQRDPEPHFGSGSSVILATMAAASVEPPIKVKSSAELVFSTSA